MGLIRSIGVCNFLPEHIERLEKETGVKPSINQIELHPSFNQAEQRKWHEDHNITDPIMESISSWIMNSTLKQFKRLLNIIIRQFRKLFYVGIINLGQLLFLNQHPRRQFENISIFDFSFK